MKMRLYAGQTCWILTPEFLLPASPAALYDPLIFKGIVDEQDLGLSPEILDEVRGMIEERYYAVVPELPQHGYGRRAGDGASAGMAGSAMERKPSI